MSWAIIAIVCTGCGRIAFDPLGSSPGDGANVDGKRVDGGADGGPSACLGNPAYTMKAGLANRYREGTALVTWAAARAACQADGADLWVPGSTDEAVAWTGDWVGITDVLAEGVWMTVGGTPAAFLPWEAGQPDGGTAENCARNTGSMFEDRDCTDTRDYVCECE